MDALDQNLSEKLPAQPIPRPRSAGDDTVPGALNQGIDYPDSGTVVLTVGGEVDIATAPRLAEMLQSRLYSTLTRLVLDLSGLEFLGVAGISVLLEADLRARYTATELVLVTGDNRQVTRALTVTAEHHHLRLHAGPVATAVPSSEH